MWIEQILQLLFVAKAVGSVAFVSVSLFAMLKYKAKNTKKFYKITSLIAAVGDSVDSQNGHQKSVILTIFACGM